MNDLATLFAYLISYYLLWEVFWLVWFLNNFFEYLGMRESLVFIMVFIPCIALQNMLPCLASTLEVEAA